MAWGLADAIVWALATMVQPEHFVFVIVGTLIGLLMGAIPGIGAALTLALTIPISFALQPIDGLLFLIGALGGVNFGGSITAIMLNVPGTAPSVVTTIDGYPMSEQGRGIEALGASATASALGAAFGVVFLLISVPIFRVLMSYVGPPEFMLVALFGLLTVALVIKGSFVNGLIAVCLGMLMSFHGFAPITGGLRFSFDLIYLNDPIPVIVLVLGVFAVSEMIKLGTAGTSIAGTSSLEGDRLSGVRAVFRELKITFQSSIVGIVIGFVPAAGAVLATIIAYARTMAQAADPSQFGKGDIRGVIAAEAANDAKDGGALLPTIAFAIPGTAAHAVLLGGLLLHGLTPGPNIFVEELNFVYLLIFGLLVSNILTSTIGLGFIHYIAKVTTIPSDVIVPSVVVISMFGSFALRNNPLDMVVVLILGVLGYVAMVYSVSRVALLFGLILGPIVENTVHQTVQMSLGNPVNILSRPVFAAILVITLLVVAYLGLREPVEPGPG